LDDKFFKDLRLYTAAEHETNEEKSQAFTNTQLHSYLRSPLHSENDKHCSHTCTHEEN
jgi:hypothetical protein